MMQYIPYALAVVVVALVIVRALWSRRTVLEYHRALKYSNGRFVGVLGPGRHWVFRQNTILRVVDVRPTFVMVPGQEVLSSDGITLKVSMAAKYQIVDPEKAVNEIENYVEALYLALQVSLRTMIGSATIDELLEKRDGFGKQLAESASASVEEIGLKLLSVDIKDIMLPGEVKKLFNQIVKARKEGLAALEKARGETAALRNLANAARMVEDSPGLMQLRMLQQFGESTGNTLVMGMPASSTVLPIKGKPGAEPAAEPPESP